MPVIDFGWLSPLACQLYSSEVREKLSRTLKPADRVWVGGGYDVEPPWRGGRQGFWGMLVRFVPGWNPGSPAALGQTDDEVTFDRVAGRNLVLALR